MNRYQTGVAIEQDMQRGDVFLEIKCYGQTPAEENRRASYYSFKIKRLPTGQWAADATN